jgi:hypothetical protein
LLLYAPAFADLREKVADRLWESAKVKYQLTKSLEAACPDALPKAPNA